MIYYDPFWMFNPFKIIKILKKIQEPERKSAGESKDRLDAYANNSRMAATSGAIKSAKNTVERFKEGANYSDIDTLYEKYKLKKILNSLSFLSGTPFLGTGMKYGTKVLVGTINVLGDKDARKDLVESIKTSEGRSEIVKITKSELSKIGDKIDKKIDSFVDKGKKVVKSFSDNIKPVIDTIKDKTSKTLDYISSGVDTAWSKAKNVASRAFGAVKDVVGRFASVFGF